MALVFRFGQEVYEADSCVPVRRATEAGEIEFGALARGDYPGTPMPPNWLEGIRTMGYWDTPRPQNWGLDWHRNEGIEFTFVSGGRTGFSAGGVEYDLSKNYLAVTRPWQSHRLGDPNIGSCRLHWIIIDVDVRRPNQKWHWPDWLVLPEDDLTHLTQLLHQNEHPVWLANDAVGSAFEAIAALVSQPIENTRQSRLRLLVNSLLVEILDLLASQWVPLDVELTSTKRNVELFLKDLSDSAELPWTLDRMSETCGLSRTQFAKHCKDLTNMTPVEYLVSCRIERAKRFLREKPELSVTDISGLCGFDSSQYFSNAFKKTTGISPRQYRFGNSAEEHETSTQA